MAEVCDADIIKWSKIIILMMTVMQQMRSAFILSDKYFVIQMVCLKGLMSFTRSFCLFESKQNKIQQQTKGALTYGCTLGCNVCVIQGLAFTLRLVW